MVAEKSTPGRPRDPETERRILAVTLRHLAQDGYARMSLDNIAIDAGVSKPTIYRRWPGKADLATAALRTLQLAEPSVDTGTTPGDLAQVLANFSRNLLRPNGMSLIGTVLAEEAHTPDLLALFRQRIVAPRRQMLRGILQRARRNGELRRGANIEAAINMLVGAFYARYLSGDPIPETFARDTVKIVWPGISSDRA